MRVRSIVVCLVVVAGMGGQCLAQFRDAPTEGSKLGDSVVQRWRAGVIITARSGPCQGLVGTAPLPTDWPEQETKIVEEDFSPTAKVSYRVVEGTVKQMVVEIPYLPAGEECRAIVTVEVRRSSQVRPDDTSVFVLPNKRKLPRDVLPYLAPSPGIECTSAKIKSTARQFDVQEEGAWDQIEAIYDWVRENVAFEDNRGGRVKGALETLRDGTGDCDEMTSLFIAICRAASIPARTVRVPGHCYPEFYLEDAEGRGHWFPCQAAGTRAFGEMPEHRPVLQKGDNLLLRDPQTKRPARSRFLPDHLTIADAQAPPRFELVLERVPD